MEVESATIFSHIKGTFGGYVTAKECHHIVKDILLKVASITC